MAAQFSQTTRSLAGDTSRYANIAWLLSGALLLGWSVWFFFGSVTVYEISRRARLEARQASHHVAAPLARTVIATDLAIGREVRAGDVLVRLDARSEGLRLQEEEARLDAIPRRIASLRREIEANENARDNDLQAARAASDVARSRNQEADAALEFAKGHQERMAQLSSTGNGTRVEAVKAVSETRKLTAARDALSADLRRVELEARARAWQHDAQIETLRNVIVSLEGELATTRVTIERLKIDLEKHVVRAPVAGRLGDVVPLHVGAYVAEGQRLATIVPEGDLAIVAEFNPSGTIGRVQPGQTARLRLDGFPWAEYGTVTATVSRVASEIRDNSIRVEFVLDSRPAAGSILQHGLPGTVEVNVEEPSPASLALRAAGLVISAPTRSRVSLAESAR
ncbi:MAG: HlyD family efflux transporter periplasmic adaptor subunit [Reyranellaceae bacterium]